MSLYNPVFFPVYILNLPDRQDRRDHILKQFRNREEFDIQLVDACWHPIGAVGLWNSIKKVVDMATEKNHECIILCEDDHTFTSDYSREYFTANLVAALTKGMDLLLGGIGGCTYAIPVANNRFWVERFICTQFTVIHRDFFQQIREESFTDQDAADDKFSSMTINKLVIYPFISVQTEFGYSDISSDPGRRPVTALFEATSGFLGNLQKIYSFYNG